MSQRCTIQAQGKTLIWRLRAVLALVLTVILGCSHAEDLDATPKGAIEVSDGGEGTLDVEAGDRVDWLKLPAFEDGTVTMKVTLSAGDAKVDKGRISVKRGTPPRIQEAHEKFQLKSGKEKRVSLNWPVSDGAQYYVKVRAREGALSYTYTLEWNEAVAQPSSPEPDTDKASEEAKAAVVPPKEPDSQLNNPPKKETSKPPVFTSSIASIDDELRIQMEAGSSWHTDCPIPLKDLRLLELSHWDKKGQPKLGQLIVHRTVAKETVTIFRKLFESHYPIERMRLIHEYDASDEKSVKDNNTSAFCCRLKTGIKTARSSRDWSRHSFGKAIDINPKFNPYVAKNGKVVIPDAGRSYDSQRERDALRGEVPELIFEGDTVHKAFVRRGWRWGGAWKSLKDYQHFEKR